MLQVFSSVGGVVETQDLIYGLNARNDISTGGGADMVFGAIGADVIDTGSDDDRVMGLGGDDFIDGGVGFDQALYRNSISDYTIFLNSRGQVVIDHDGLGQVAANDGTDTLTDVEEAIFNDAALDLTSVRNVILSPSETATLMYTVEEFDGLTVSEFNGGDSLQFVNVNFDRASLTVTYGSAILDIDLDLDGIIDSTVTLEGEFRNGDFMAVAYDGNTAVTFETFLPDLQEGQSIDPDLVNGINNQDFLRGDGSTDFKVTLQDMGFAGYDNVVGVYEIDASGNIVDTRILFENANSDKVAEASITDVEAGNKLGFFIVQDAADWATTLAAGDTLSFVNSSGAAANIADGSDISIALNDYRLTPVGSLFECNSRY
jgi:hypothetical protein